MISLRKKFIFVHIPKTGGNSIQERLSKYSEDEIVSREEYQDGIERFEIKGSVGGLSKHATLAQYRLAMGRTLFVNMYKCAVIRNPWDMMISHYFSPHRKCENWNRGDFIELLKRTPSLRYYLGYCGFRRTARLGGIEKLIVRRLQDRVDLLLKYENLESDYKILCEALCLPYRPLEKRNSSQKEHYSKYYDRELMAMVAKKFSEEINIGNYRFEGIE